MLCLVFMSHAGYMRRSGSPQNNFVFPSSHESSPVPPSSTYSLPALLYNPYPGHRDAGTACKQRVRCYCLPISTLLHCSSSTSPCGNSAHSASHATYTRHAQSHTGVICHPIPGSAGKNIISIIGLRNNQPEPEACGSKSPMVS